MKTLVISVEDVKHNCSIIKKRAGNARIYAVIKADGYGLGILPFANLLRDQGISSFAITEPKEAELLRKNGFTEQEILMLRSTTEREELEMLIDLNVVCTIGSYEAAVALNGIAESRSTIVEAHIEIDTGMGRYGFLTTELDKITSVYEYMPNIAVTGIFTHFHSAFSSKKDTMKQLNQFRQVIDKLHEKGFETGTAHCANSSALFKYEDACLDAVRVGSAFLGRLAFRNSAGLRKIGYAEATVDELRWLPKGHTIGYGAAYKTKKVTRVAVISIGYYHGFGMEKGRDLFRWRDAVRGCLSLIKSALTGKALYVRIGDKKMRVLGHVGMLHAVIDVTDITCNLGDRVVLELNPLHAKGLEVAYR